MGIGLISKYRFGVEGVAQELQSNFQSQIETYLPQFQGARVSCREKEGVLMIAAEIDNTLYGIYFDSSTNNIKTDYARLSNL